MIGSLNLAPRRRRIRPHFVVQNRNVRTREVMRYLRHLHRIHRRPLVVVLDWLNVHRSAVCRLHERGATWLHVEWLPAYTPDLNPVEAIWSHAKYSALANFIPDDVDQLYDAVIQAVGDVHFRLPLPQSFFHAAKLNL